MLWTDLSQENYYFHYISIFIDYRSRLYEVVVFIWTEMPISSQDIILIEPVSVIE